VNAQLQPATLNDNELRATIYFAVGVASEGSNRGRNVAYELAFAGYIHREGDTARGQPREAGVYREGELEPIYNSGYSIGMLQTQFVVPFAVEDSLIVEAKSRVPATVVAQATN
jgi:hypothetical protein